MIIWIILFGGLFILLTVPARLFGWLCGLLVVMALRPRKPPTRPPIT